MEKTSGGTRRPTRLSALQSRCRLGPGFLEAVYQEALTIELSERGVPHEREVDVSVFYGDRPLTCGYRADFVCSGEVIVELKAVRRVTDVERAQVINYLKATGLQRALLLNFGAPSLEYHRPVREHSNL